MGKYRPSCCWGSFVRRPCFFIQQAWLDILSIYLPILNLIGGWWSQRIQNSVRHCAEKSWPNIWSSFTPRWPDHRYPTSMRSKGGAGMHAVKHKIPKSRRRNPWSYPPQACKSIFSLNEGLQKPQTYNQAWSYRAYWCTSLGLLDYWTASLARCG